MLFPPRPITTVTVFTSSLKYGRGYGGFSLIELAVVIFIVGLLLGGIVVPLSTQFEIRKYDQTQRILDQAREALIGFAAANGYFPCPASSTSNGQEASPNHTTGACDPAVTFGTTALIGFLPAVTLGFTPVDASGYAVDAWGSTQNRIRYAVSNQTINAQLNPFTKINGMRNATMGYLTNPQNPIGTTVYLLHVCNTASASTIDCSSAAARLALNVPVVIWSLGPNAATGGTSADEIENLDNDRIFVSRTKTAIGEGGGEFDDIVTWIGMPALLSRLIAAGQLP